MKKDKKTLLTKAYQKRLQTLVNMYDFNNTDLGLNLFVDHLRYIRDCFVLDNLNNLEDEDIKTDIATINTAIAEFDAYGAAQTQEQKMFHWNTFCDFVKINMEEWLA